MIDHHLLFFSYICLSISFDYQSLPLMSKVKKSSELEPTKSRTEPSVSQNIMSSLTFGKKNYYYMLGGLALIFLGLMLMAGGHMPSADVWDESLIYSTRRTLIAPILILAGLALQIVAIFTKKQ